MARGQLAEVSCADCEFDETEERYCLLCPIFREKREWRKNCRQEFPTNVQGEDYDD